MMSADQMIELLRQALMTAVILTLPILLVTLAVGLVSSALQTVMQLHDPALNFVPRLLAVVLVAIVTLPWGLEMLREYATDLYRGIPSQL